jgi:hypothetical protein
MDDVVEKQVPLEKRVVMSREPYRPAAVLPSQLSLAAAPSFLRLHPSLSLQPSYLLNRLYFLDMTLALQF